MGQEEEEGISEFPEKLQTKENGEIPENHLKSKIEQQRSKKSINEDGKTVWR